MLFDELSEAVAGKGRIVRFDQAAAGWMARHHSASGNRAALMISLLGNEVLYAIVGIIAVCYLIRREWPRAVFLIIAFGGGTVLNTLLKTRYHRDRPIFANAFSVDATSFPSGHAMAAFIGWGALAYLIAAHFHHHAPRRVIFFLAMILIAAIGFTRVYLAVHFLSDVVAGYAAGAVWLFVCISAFRFAHLARVGE
jgi:undecaprenyl-diphosphatase